LERIVKKPKQNKTKTTTKKPKKPKLKPDPYHYFIVRIETAH